MEPTLEEKDKNMSMPMLESATKEKNLYQVYPQRWWLLMSVILLNTANDAHWVAFPSVAKQTAKYYDKTGEVMDYIPTVSFAVGLPAIFIATFVIEKFGLKVCLKTGGILSGFGR